MKFQYQYTCTQPNGLNLLAIARIVKIVLRSYSEVSMDANGRRADAQNFCRLLSLSVRNGDEVKVTVDGGDGYDVMRNIEAVLTNQPEMETKPEDNPWEPQAVFA